MNPVSSVGGGGSIEQIIALRQQIIERSKVLQDVHQPKTEAPTEAASPTPSFGDSLRGVAHPAAMVDVLEMVLEWLLLQGVGGSWCGLEA